MQAACITTPMSSTCVAKNNKNLRKHSQFLSSLVRLPAMVMRNYSGETQFMDSSVLFSFNEAMSFGTKVFHPIFATTFLLEINLLSDPAV